MQSAEKQFLQSLEEMLCTNEDKVIIPYSKVNQAIADFVVKNAKVVTKLQDKVIRQLNKQLVLRDNSLNGVYTGILRGLDVWQADARFALDQLAAKGGLSQPGQTLEQALLNEVGQAPQLAFGATLVLAVKEAVPWLDRIAIALEKIAVVMSAEAGNLVESVEEPELIDIDESAVPDYEAEVGIDWPVVQEESS